MITLCIIVTVLLVLICGCTAYVCCIMAGKADDELEQKYGIRRS